MRVGNLDQDPQAKKSVSPTGQYPFAQKKQNLSGENPESLAETRFAAAPPENCTKDQLFAWWTAKLEDAQFLRFKVAEWRMDLSFIVSLGQSLLQREKFWSERKFDARAVGLMVINGSLNLEQPNTAANHKSRLVQYLTDLATPAPTATDANTAAIAVRPAALVAEDAKRAEIQEQERLAELEFGDTPEARLRYWLQSYQDNVLNQSWDSAAGAALRGRAVRKHQAKFEGCMREIHGADWENQQIDDYLANHAIAS